MEKYDVVIIGAGVVGTAVARFLSRYDTRVLVIEKEEDVCSGTSKANSGIVHAGYDAKSGTMKARMNVRGAELIRELSETLDFPYRNNGSLVLCMQEEELPGLQALYDRGITNGVKGLRILSRKEVLKLEPAVSESVCGALYAPTAGTVCPFGMTVAFAENAAENGVCFRFLEAVSEINKKRDTGFLVMTDKGEVCARAVVNAAGLYADVFHNMVSSEHLTITPRRGEYVLLDKEAGGLIRHTIFQLPGKLGKGVLVTPTVHGNLMVGPNAEDVEEKEDTETTAAGMEDIKARGLKSVPTLPYQKMITGFSGLRAHGDTGDFVIGEVSGCEGFFEAAAIESPGLTAAPAIGEYLAELIAKKYGLKEKTGYKETRKGFTEVSKLPASERAELIRKNPLYGNIVCRCEEISEGEIVDAIRRPIGAKSMDGVKRRVRQGMGRCQAGFCTPRAMEILARELNIPVSEVTKNRPGSELLRKEQG